MAHALLYFLTPQALLSCRRLQAYVETLLLPVPLTDAGIKQMILKVLPICPGCCILVSILCSLVFETDWVPRTYFAVTERMARMDKTAVCEIHAQDEIYVCG